MAGNTEANHYSKPVLNVVEKDAVHSSRLVRSQPLICKLLPVVAVFCFLAWCLVALKSDFAWDDAEPEILDQAWHLARGESIYRGIDSPPFAFSIYPPLYLGLVALAMKFVGLSYLPAKLLSFFAGIAIGWALLRLGKLWNKPGGLWAAFFLFLVPAFLYNVVRSHVQMLAVAFSIWALFFFIRGRKKDALLISPLLTVLAFYTKQTQIALPLALAAYLVVRNRRWLLPYLSVLTAGVLIPFLFLQKITDGYFLLNTFQLAKLRFDLPMMPLVFLHHAGPALIFISIAGWNFWRRLRSLTLEPIDYYFASVLLITLISLGRVGAHGQYVLELLVVTLVYLLRLTGLPAIRGREALVSIQALVLFFYTPFFVFFEEGQWNRAANRASRQIYASILERPGPILSQQGSFALFGSGAIYIQLFHFSELARLGIWDQAHIVNAINQQTFSHVITQFEIAQPEISADDRERFTPEMITALRKHYRLEKDVYPYFLYTPVK